MFWKKRCLQEGEKTLKEKFGIQALSMAVYSYIGTMDKLARISYVNYKPSIKPAIYALWHGWQYGLTAIRGKDRKNTLNILISQSNDGEIIAKVVETMGFMTIRGSQKRGGTKALREIISALKKGQTLAYTVDGPKGPLQEVKPGIIKIAQMSQVPIIPFVPYSRKFFEANSWDKYRLPMIGAPYTAAFGDPIYIPRDIDEDEAEQYRILLEQKLHELNDIATKTYHSK
jgi:hypothetical protein